MVTGVDRYLNKELWTPQAFERDFGEEPADLVDCQLGMVLLQLPSKTFWAGFDNMSCEYRQMKEVRVAPWPKSFCVRIVLLCTH